MDFQEFPKLLYKGGDISAEYVVVLDEAGEDAADGFEAANLDPDAVADAPKKRGRPAKVQ